MKLDSIYIASTGIYLPNPVNVKEAVVSGLYSAREASETRLESVLVENTVPAPDMAIYAARQALTNMNICPDEISLMLHASVCFQGLAFSSIASYINNAVIKSPTALALEIKGLSNGGMASIEIAAAYLTSTSTNYAMITTADRFQQEWFDRWNADTGMVMADGAAAIILSRKKGFAKLISIATESDSTLERLHRGQCKFEKAPQKIDVHQRKKDYLSEVGLDSMLSRFQAGLKKSVERALTEADLNIDSIARFIVPHVGYILFQREYVEALKISEDATTWHWGKTIGHMGAGDQIAGLNYLVTRGILNKGDYCLLLGVGAGFSWTSAIIKYM